MALQTPFHVERGRLPGEGHLGQLAVTSSAGHAPFDVNAVIEISEIRQIVNAVPHEGAVISKTGPHGF